MSLFKRGKDGGKWSIRIRIGNGSVRIPAYRDKKRSRQYERELLDLRDAGLWHTRGHYKAEKAKPITDHLADYLDSLKVKGRAPMYAYTTEKRLRKIIEESGWQRLGDTSLDGFERWQKVASEEKTRFGKPRSPKTLNQFKDCLHGFMEWCVRRDRLPHNPLEKAEDIREYPNELYRRSITKEQFEALVRVAPLDRKRLYQFVMATGLRKGTLRTLKWEDINIGPTVIVPHVRVKAQEMKGRRAHIIPLAKETVSMLKQMGKGKQPADLVFPDLKRKLHRFREDIDKAGIPFETPEGRFDFHAFRKTMIQRAYEAGIPLEVMSAILHHKDIRTTQRHYHNPSLDRAAEAVDGLQKSKQPKRKRA